MQQQNEPKISEQNKRLPEEIEYSVSAKKPLPNRHVIRLINGQPVCISCESRHTLKVDMEELANLGEIVVDFN